MRRAVVLIAFAGLLLFVSTLAQAQAPQPGPDHKKLEVWVGEWKYEGDIKESPIGPAGKLSGKQNGRMVMNGFALEWTGEESGAFGNVKWGEMDTYNTATKKYALLGYQDDGGTWTGTMSAKGTTWSGSGTLVDKGKSYKTRSKGTFSADGKTFTWKGEISTDGKTWAPWTEGKMTK